MYRLSGPPGFGASGGGAVDDGVGPGLRRRTQQSPRDGLAGGDCRALRVIVKRIIANKRMHRRQYWRPTTKSYAFVAQLCPWF